MTGHGKLGHLQSVLVAAMVIAIVAIAASSASFAQSDEALAVAVRGSSFEPDGSTSLIVNVTGTAKPDVLEAAAFSVTENGERVGDLTVEPLLETAKSTIVAVLALDVSGSMSGEPLASIQAAAVETVESLTAQGIEVGLLDFASEPRVLREPTLDTAALEEAIAGLTAGGQTTLFDAVVLGVEQLADRDAIRSLVVIADGEDNASAASLEEAIAAANDADVAITVMALETDLLDPEVLRPLATQTDGTFYTAAETAQFSAVLAEVAGDVASQYVLSYRSGRYEPPELDLVVEVSAGGVETTAGFVVANVREPFAVDAAPAPPSAELFDPGVLGGAVALWIGLGLLFLAFLLVLLLLLVPRGDRRATRTLERGVTMVERGDGSSRQVPEAGLYASAIGRRAVDMVERAPMPKGYEDRLQTELDRAGWQLRAGEFLTVRVIATLGGLAVFWALSGRLWLGLLGALAGAVVPVLVLSSRRDRRQARFMAQLPDTLQLLAGTLKAGYGVLQAIDTVVKEVEEPTSSEFQRALTEARLGLPLEDSLGGMADRIGDDDFRWVVVAMNIQRQVGGNLAELLETVAATLRGREQVRRQIKALTAEGRLSAIILIILPFLVLGYLLVVNPTYLIPLVTTVFGLAMAAVAAALMVVGIFWMRKMIQIDV